MKPGVRPSRVFQRYASLAATLLLVNLVPAQAAQPPIVPSAANASAHSGTLDGAERMLAAIRASLVERSLEAPTRVLSIGWIDAGGTLHETSQFRTDARVRGVRVLGYFSDEQGEARTRVSAEIDIPASLRAVTSGPTCTDAPPRWRIPVSLHLVDANARGQEHGMSRALSASLAALLLANEGSLARWTLVRELAPPGSTYAKALSGATATVPDWTLSLSVRPVEPPKGSWLEPATRFATSLVTGVSAQVPSWRVELGLRRTGDAGEVLRIEETMVIDGRLGTTPDQVMGHVVQRFPDWIARLDQQAACESPQYTLLQRAPGEWAIGAGASTGLRAGDRVLVVDRRSVPLRVLEPGAAGLLAIAEVVRVTPEQVRVRQVAGPGLPETGNWAAFPF